jgi:myxalamid-type polyketide synthase MxaB
MQQAKHVGKVVIELDQSPVVVGDEIEIAFRKQQSWVPRLESYQPGDVAPYSINPQASYVLVGGLGGLGLLMIEDLVRRGARNIFVCGRSSPSGEIKSTLDKIQKNEAVQIQTSQVDILNASALEQWFKSINTIAPIKGIFFLAGQLSDGLISNLNWPQFQEVLDVKTIGLSQVDQVSRKYPLDFFIAFSSLTAITGSPGQSNYVAANSFVDGLMCLRRDQGLPGNAIDWGPWKEAGMAQRLSSMQTQRLLDLGILPLETRQSLQVLDSLGSQSPTQLGVMKIDWSKFLKNFPKANTNPMYERISHTESIRLDHLELSSNTNKIEGQDWLDILLSTHQAQRNKRLLELLEGAVNQVIGANESEAIGLRKPLFDLGLDSLTAVELKNRVEKNLKCVLSSTLLFDYPTLEALSEHLKTLISIPFSPNVADEKNISRVATTQANEDLDEMTEEDLVLRLASKIKK